MPKAYISLYYSYREQLEILPDDERGRLIIALLDYAENGTIPTLEGASNMAFAFIKAQIDRDTEKYNERCQKNRDNIRKRWNPENTNEYDGIQSYTKHTKEKEKEKKKESIIGQPSVAEDTRPNFVPPTLEEVEAYCQSGKTTFPHKGSLTTTRRAAGCWEIHLWKAGKRRSVHGRAGTPAASRRANLEPQSYT